MSQFEEANSKGPFMVVYEPQPRADISKVDAIKALRSLTGWLLMDSKRAIEQGFRYDAKDRGSQVAMINQLAQFGVKCTKG
jgi:ribosomal protein L7/L12